MRRTRVLGAALVAAGCGPSAPPETVATRDSAGVAIVENRRALLGDAVAVAVDTAAVISVGRGEPAGEFGGEVGVVRLPNGTLVVGFDEQLRMFDPSGRWIRTVGRRGAGPGEFRQLTLLAPVGDSLLVYDLGTRRITVFDSAGQLGRVTTVVASDSTGEVFPVAAFDDGRLLMGSYPDPARAGLQRDSIGLAIGDAEGRTTDPLGRFPWVDQLIEPGPRGPVQSRVAFARMATWTTFGSLALVATNEGFWFDWYDMAGRRIRSVRRPWTPEPVTEALVQQWIDEITADFPAGMDDRKLAFRREMAARPRLPFKPSYAKVLVSEAGFVWVQEFGEPGQPERPSVYSVFDREGRWLARVSLPTGVDPKVIGSDDLVASRRDADGVVSVVIYRLLPPLRSAPRPASP